MRLIGEHHLRAVADGRAAGSVIRVLEQYAGKSERTALNRRWLAPVERAGGERGETERRDGQLWVWRMDGGFEQRPGGFAVEIQVEGAQEGDPHVAMQIASGQRQ